MEEESQQKHGLRGNRGPGTGGEQLEMDEDRKEIRRSLAPVSAAFKSTSSQSEALGKHSCTSHDVCLLPCIEIWQSTKLTNTVCTGKAVIMAKTHYREKLGSFFSAVDFERMGKGLQHITDHRTITSAKVHKALR